MAKQRYQLVAEVPEEIYKDLKAALIRDEITFKHWLEAAAQAYINKRPISHRRLVAQAEEAIKKAKEKQK